MHGMYCWNLHSWVPYWRILAIVHTYGNKNYEKAWKSSWKVCGFNECDSEAGKSFVTSVKMCSENAKSCLVPVHCKYHDFTWNTWNYHMPCCYWCGRVSHIQILVKFFLLNPWLSILVRWRKSFLINKQHFQVIEAEKQNQWLNAKETQLKYDSNGVMFLLH